MHEITLIQIHSGKSWKHFHIKYEVEDEESVLENVCIIHIWVNRRMT